MKYVPLFMLSLISATFAFTLPLRMSMHDDYLRSLSVQPYDRLNNLQNAKVTDKENIEVNTILFNMWKIDNVFFNRNSKTIMFKLKEDMDNIFVKTDEELERLPKATKIYSKAFRNFLFYPMNSTDVDAIMYMERI